ncbi:MAG: hypothetical protein ABR583_10105 [Gaiellaceae bacterium]
MRDEASFAGAAAYGYCASKSEWVWGVRLVLRTDRRGLPLGYTLVPANVHEYEPLLELVEAGETVIANKGLWGRAYNERMACAEVLLLTPSRERTAAESVFANLKEQMRLERHLAKTDSTATRPSRIAFRSLRQSRRGSSAFWMRRSSSSLGTRGGAGMVASL